MNVLNALKYDSQSNFSNSKSRGEPKGRGNAKICIENDETYGWDEKHFESKWLR